MMQRAIDKEMRRAMTISIRSFLLVQQVPCQTLRLGCTIVGVPRFDARLLAGLVHLTRTTEEHDSTIDCSNYCLCRCGVDVSFVLLCPSRILSVEALPLATLVGGQSLAPLIMII